MQLVIYYLQFTEVGMTETNDHPTQAAVPDEEIGTAADHDERQRFFRAKIQQGRKILFRCWFDVEIGFAAPPQSGPFREWLIFSQGRLGPEPRSQLSK